MSRKDFVKDTVKLFKDVDTGLRLTTGKSLREILGRTASLFVKSELEEAEDPYGVLCITPTASDKVVKFAFRTAAFEFHPDTGVHPDTARYQKAVEAYKAIQKERESPQQG